MYLTTIKTTTTTTRTGQICPRAHSKGQISTPVGGLLRPGSSAWYYTATGMEVTQIKPGAQSPSVCVAVDSGLGFTTSRNGQSHRASSGRQYQIQQDAGVLGSDRRRRHQRVGREESRGPGGSETGMS